MFYEAPEAKFFCFAPVQNIAKADWDWSIDDDGINGTGSEIDLPYIDENGEGDPNK